MFKQAICAFIAAMMPVGSLSACTPPLADGEDSTQDPATTESRTIRCLAARAITKIEEIEAASSDESTPSED